MEPPVDQPPRPPKPSSLLARIVESFYFAFCGLGYLFRTQRNARIELLIGVIACALGFWFRITTTEWCILVLTIAIVLVLEGLNTALEAAVDLASPEVHPLAKTAKDVAAAMVLIAAIASIVIGVLIFGSRLWQR
jgi:diacylglycerol kinase